MKIGLSGLIVILIAPTLPSNSIPIFSATGLWLAIQQILIGVALGLTMQFAFAAVRLADEVIGMQMWLSFATFFDPSGGLNMPVLARILNLLAMLLFLSFNGHLWLISMLDDSFHTLPIHSQPLNGNSFLMLAQVGSIIFTNGLMLALPANLSAADTEHGACLTQSHNTAAIGVCYRLSNHHDHWYNDHRHDDPDAGAVLRAPVC